VHAQLIIRFTPATGSTMVMPPTVSIVHPDRPLECERALRPGMDALRAWAVEAGWGEGEVDDALLLLVMTRQIERESGSDIECLMQRARIAAECEDGSGTH
jgi:hypothetical protein